APWNIPQSTSTFACLVCSKYAELVTSPPPAPKIVIFIEEVPLRYSYQVQQIFVSDRPPEAALQPAADESRMPQAINDWWTTPHNFPDQAGSKVFNHQYDRPLIDSKMIR